MISTRDISGDSGAWGTFESVRDRLFDQFEDIPFDPNSGIAAEALGVLVENHLRCHPDQSHVLLKAHLFRIVITRGQISVDPVDWFASKVNHGHLVSKVRDRWHGEVRQGMLADESAWSDRMYEIGLMRGGLDMHHIAPGWENVFAGGLTGLLARARRARAGLGEGATPEQLAFYEAVEIVYEASIALALRLADAAEREADRCPGHAARLRQVAANCRRVPAHKPQTLHQALQCVYFLQMLIEIEGESPMSLGHFDRMLGPYYQADLDAGRITRDQAKELMKFFWMKYHARMRGRGDSARNFLFGGQDRDGDDAVNEFTYMALEAFEELNEPDPKLSIRFFPGTTDRFYRRIAELIRNGHNSLVLLNDAAAVEALVRRGKSLADARSYLPIGCYEPAVDGKEAACTMNMPVNMAKVLQLALHDGVDPDSGEAVGPRTGDARAFETFQQVYNAYRRQMEFLLARSMENIRAHERQWPESNPSPLLAGTIDDCLARGRDVGQGGARYNSVGSIGVALGSTVDSLAALRQAVFEEKRFTMGQILDATARNFEGDEPMRQYLANRAGKWGNGDGRVDALAREIARHYCSTVHSMTNARGGPCQGALFALRFQWYYGQRTGALPDGRKAHTPLAPGVGASPGRDRRGVTALIQSVSALDFTLTPDGSVLDIMLHPSSIRGEKGIDSIVTLIKTFFAQGGYGLQFNVFDTEMLRDAQRDPEQYANLQIRVTGYSAHFTKLSAYEQDLFIARNTHTA